MFLGGSWTADTAEKAKRFTETAELFGLPVINLVDNLPRKCPVGLRDYPQSLRRRGRGDE